MRKTLAAAALAASLLPALQAHADPVAYLRAQLAKTPDAGKIVKTFSGPEGLTGVVLVVRNGQKMVAYVTPSGRYLISGAVIDMMTGQNVTLMEANKYIGQDALPNKQKSEATIYKMGQMQSATFGNPQAHAYIGVVFDPSTDAGKRVLISAMDMAVKLHQNHDERLLQIRFFPYGPMAPTLLTGSNVDRLRNILKLATGKPLPTPTASAKTFGERNTAVASSLPLKPPILIVYDQTSHFARAVSLGNGQMSQQTMSAFVSAQNALASGGKP